MTFFRFQCDFIQKSLRKKVLLQWKIHRIKGCLQPWKKRVLIPKTPRAIFNKLIQKKSPFYENFSDLISCSQGLELFSWYFFLRIYFLQYSLILFPETLLAVPILFQEKSTGNSKLRTLFPVTFCSRTSENWDFFIKVFISMFFFRKFFYCDFLTQIYWP